MGNAGSVRAPVSGRRLLALGLAVAMLASCAGQASPQEQVRPSTTLQATIPPFPMPPLPFHVPKGNGCGRDCFRSSTIAIVDARSGEVRTLGLPVNMYDGPAVSPDGSRIAMVAGWRQIVVVDIETLDITIVRSIEDGDLWEPTWSPDGKSLIYARTPPEGLGARIEVAPVDGGPPVDLVTGLGPSWSPDGRWIAYGKRGDEVWLVRPDGSDAHLLTHGFSPMWTGDSSAVVVSVLHHGFSTIDQVDIDDGHLIDELSQGQQGAVSPDGSLLGVLREVRPLQLRLWIGPVSAPDRIAQLIKQEVITFSWFPDGQRLAVEIPTY